MLRHVLTTVSKTSCWQSALEAVWRVKRNREEERVATTVSICTNSSHGFIKHVSHQHCLDLSYHWHTGCNRMKHISLKSTRTATHPLSIVLFSLISNGQASSDFQILECTIQKFKILCHSEHHDENSYNLTPYPLQGM